MNTSSGATKGVGRYTTSALFVAIFSLIVLAALSKTARAQTFFGSVVGTVTDDSGAVIPGASVTITDLGTNEARTAKTDAAGDYRFVNLVPASYKVSVESPNFKRFLRQPIQVDVNATVRADAALQLGEVTETVQVTTATPLLQTESGTLASTVDAKQVAAMPLNGRNTLNLMELVPGVVPQGNTSGGAALNSGVGSAAGPATSSAAFGNYQIGGAFPLQSSMYIDGASIEYLNKNFPGIVPVQDLIQEFTIQTSAVSAEYGRFGGGVVSMTTKSGSNQFHGSVYEYFRNNIFNANYFFTKRTGAARPQFNQNQFGGTVSGPIWKDKAFFFFGWEGTHIRTGVPYLTSIPTPAMRTGVIPEVYIGSVLQNSKVSDPRGKCNVTHQAGTPTSPGTWTITNLSTCVDPTAALLATFYPNNVNVTNNASYNYATTVSTGTDGHQMAGRLDYNVTNANRLFFRFLMWPLADKAPNYLGNANGWNSANIQHHLFANQYAVGDTHTFNPTTILDVRADFLRAYGDAIPPVMGNANVPQFGSAYSALAPYFSFNDYPAWNFANGTLHNLFAFNYNSIVQTYYNNYHLSGSVTKIIGRHALKVGAEGLLQQREDIGSDSSPDGLFTFGYDLGGDEWANFLFGSFDKAVATTIKRTTTFNYYSGYYAQDTWQALPRLTLNVGLRLDLPGAPTENNNNASVLLPYTTDPNTGIYGTAGLVASSLYPNRSTLVPIHNAFGPRFGFAYRLTDNTVFRGGYGLSYLPNDAQTGSWATNAPINSAATTNTNTATNLNPTNYANGCSSGGPTTTLCYTLSNPFPATSQYPNGIGPALGRANTTFVKNYIGSSLSAPYPYEPYPHSQELNLTIGHQFPGDMAVTAGYAHTLGTHLASLSAGLDQLPDQYDSLGTALAAAPSTSIVYAGVKLPSAYQTYGQTLRPYPAYSNYLNSTSYHGTSSYDALEVTMQKRFKGVGQIGLSYAWSKFLSDTDTVLTSQETESGGAGGNGEGLYQDYYNPKAERSLYSYDVPNRLVVNYVLNLPFGRGQRFASNIGGIADRAISGWSVNGITTLESGYPVYLNTSGNQLSKFFGAGTIRPNYTAGCVKTINDSGYNRTLTGHTWFNTSCFTLPSSTTASTGALLTGQNAYAFGNEPRVDDAIKSSGVDNWDFSLEKATRLHEQVALIFRAEFFNTFNRVQFAPPVTQADSTQFGQILQQSNQPRLIQFAMRVNF